MSEKNIKPTAVNEYLLWVEKTVDPKTDLYRAVHPYLENLRAAAPSEDKTRPFLSVITRTQGKRPQMLTETLLCLTGQSDPDFELLLMGHNLNEEQDAVVRGIIDDLPLPMRKKTRLIPVTGGTRTTPLNEGFRAARGKYIAVLDDDDLVFDNWVETFRASYEKAPGRILHSYAFSQDWETVGDEKNAAPRAAGTPSNYYCRDFVLLNQLLSNSCPLMSLAFPAEAYHTLGLRFDESLTTTEDWDFLMRTSFLAGVYNNETPTSIYRFWKNAENSQTLHRREEWLKNYSKILQKFKKTPLILPVGSLDDLYDRALQNKPDATDEDEPDKTVDATLFYHTGAGFSEQCSITRPYTFKKGAASEVVFDGLSDFGNIHEIRIDPCFAGSVIVEDPRITVKTADGTEKTYRGKEILSNGYPYRNKIVFLKDDPQLIIRLPAPALLDSVRAEYRFEDTVPEEMIDALVLRRSKKRSFAYRVARKLWHIAKKILRRG